MKTKMNVALITTAVAAVIGTWQLGRTSDTPRPGAAAGAAVRPRDARTSARTFLNLVLQPREMEMSNKT